MRTLVIPDLHNHTERADYWLRTQSYERVVLLGDYFDHHDDTAEDARRTAEWLRQMLVRPEVISLWGNHDVQYWQPELLELRCPGFTEEKAQTINSVLRPEYWMRLKLAHHEQGWLVSHAGFHPAWMENATAEKIVQRCDLAMEQAVTDIVDPIFSYGEIPGGLQRYGGPLWMDWDSLVPIPGINQIVGHTPGEKVREKSGATSRNYCIDVCNGWAAALIVDGKIEVLCTPDVPDSRGIPEFQVRDARYHL